MPSGHPEQLRGTETSWPCGPLASVTSPARSTCRQLGEQHTAKVRARVLPTGILVDSTRQPPGQRLLESRPALGGGPDGQGVSLCVEHVGVQAQQVGVIREEQIQVFERLPQKEALHLIPGLWVAGVLDVADGRIAARGDLLESQGRSITMLAQPSGGLPARSAASHPRPQPPACPRTHSPPGQDLGGEDTKANRGNGHPGGQPSFPSLIRCRVPPPKPVQASQRPQGHPRGVESPSGATGQASALPG